MCELRVPLPDDQLKTAFFNTFGRKIEDFWSPCGIDYEKFCHELLDCQLELGWSKKLIARFGESAIEVLSKIGLHTMLSLMQFTLS